MSLLSWCAYYGDVSAIRTPSRSPGVSTGSFMRDCRTRAESPLHRAAAFGSLASIQWLLDAGANAELRDVNGDTPLSWASWYRRAPAVLRALCFGPHSVHPEYRALRSNLIGGPLGSEE